MRISKSQKDGSVLVITLILCVLVGLMLAAYLNLVGSQNSFTQRSQVWNNVIPLCEAGVEEALAHINYNGTTNFAINGWVLSNTNYIRTRTRSDGRCQMSISTDIQPVITVQGFLLTPVHSNYLSRTVRVKTKLNHRYPQSVLGKGAISLGGNAIVNSFNSTNSSYNTLGQYDPLKARDQATVVTDSHAAAALSLGSSMVYGKVGTAAGGTVTLGGSGVVGSTAWDNNSANLGQIQAGYKTDDINIYVPDVRLPQIAGVIPITPPSIKGVVTPKYVLGAGDYFLDSLTLNSGDTVVISGKARLYVPGDINISGGGLIDIAAGGSLELYAAGGVSLSGGGVLNETGYAINLAVYGLPTCTKFNYSGNSQFIGTVYAPEADVKFSGGTDAVGAVVGSTISFSGGMGLHYDEALQGDPTEGRYLVASWTEL